MAETKGFLEEDWEPASFPQSKTDSTWFKQTPPDQGPDALTGVQIHLLVQPGA